MALLTPIFTLELGPPGIIISYIKPHRKKNKSEFYISIEIGPDANHRQIVHLLFLLAGWSCGRRSLAFFSQCIQHDTACCFDGLVKDLFFKAASENIVKI